MTDQNLTYLVALIDRSGSMASCKTDIEGGFDTFIAEHAKADGQCLVTLVQFDDRYEVVYTDKPVAQAPKLDLQPRNMTALLDAMGRSINELGERLSKLDEDKRPGSVIFVVGTDGLENASREFDLAKVNELVTRQRETYKWQFIYLGANQDAIAVGQSMGFARGQSLTYDTDSAPVAFAAAATSSLAYRGAVASAAPGAAVSDMNDFTDEDREEALQKKT